MFYQSSKVGNSLLNILPALFGGLIGMYLIFVEKDILLAFICVGLGSLFLFFRYHVEQEEKRKTEIWKLLEQRIKEIEKLGEEE